MSLLHELVAASSRVAATRSRREKIDELAKVLRGVESDEAALAVAYLSGTVPQGRIGIGGATLSRALETTPARDPRLSIRDVDGSMETISKLQVTGSSTERTRLLGELMSRCTADEQQFLARLIAGGLRQGALEGLMTEAIARAANVPADAVRRALMFTGDVARVAKLAFEGGESALATQHLELFTPLRPMLADTAPDASEAVESFGEAFVEEKLDGARIQVHRDHGDVRVFSRDGHDVTLAAPEIVEVVRALPSTRFVLDGEAISLRPDGRPQPFQITMRRFGRKLEVERLRDELPLTPRFFDLLHLDGDDLVDASLADRSRALDDLLPSDARIDRVVTDNADEAERFFTRALDRGHEGVLVKNPTSPYEAGRRGATWLKVKPAQTLDLVVLAAEWGNGRREGWLSNLHLGARDVTTGGFAMLGKTFKGLTDEMLEWQTKWLLAHEIGRTALTVYVEPKLVLEIAFDSVQASSRYPSGMALRFARVKRRRDDKRVDEADTIETVRKIFARTHGGA